MKRRNITVTAFSRKGRLKKHIVPMAAGIITAASMYSLPVHATGVSEVLNPINNLKTLVLAIIGAVGVIILAKNVMEFAQAYQQQDSSSMNSALKGIVAGYHGRHFRSDDLPWVLKRGRRFMEIFKLGDDILALLEMVLGFWNNQINLVFSLLGQSPVSFKGGGPWAVVENLQPLFVGVGSGLVVIFFVIGFCAESVDIKSEFRLEAMLRMLIRLGIAQWLVANNLTILKAFFSSIGAMVSHIGNTTMAQVLRGIEQVFEMKKEQQRAAMEIGTGKEQSIGRSDRNAEKGTAGHGIPALRHQPHQDTDTLKRQGNGNHKRTEKAGYEQLSLSFDGGYAVCDCGRAL